MRFRRAMPATSGRGAATTGEERPYGSQEEDVRSLLRKVADKAHRLLGERPRSLVVHESAPVDVAGHAGDGEVAHEVLEPLVAARLEQRVLVEEERARDISPR